MNIEELILSGAQIVDVRTPGEFMGGNVPGSINIPLNEIPMRLEEFKKMKAPFVVCCMSGARSGQAEAYLRSEGLEAVNGGSWLDVNYVMSKVA